MAVQAWVYALFAALRFIYNLMYPTLATYLPLDKEVLHVTSLDTPYNHTYQYPILDFVGLVQQHGYNASRHFVRTKDNYLLEIHRIDSSPKCLHPRKRGGVYIQHGIMLSSDSWVLNGPDTDLAYLLADNCIDVWVGNVRGNSYVQNNNGLSKDEFFKFSYHEMAIYDLRANIDYILEETKFKKIMYVGYSMGTTLSYALLSTYPEYNDKFIRLLNLAPVVFWKHPLRPLMKAADDIFDYADAFIKYFQLKVVYPQTALVAYLGEKYCGDDNQSTQSFCAFLFSKIGIDVDRLNKTALPSILAHFPAGTSSIVVYHYNQNFKRDKFQAFDYGDTENQKRYNSITPPSYNLSNVKVPTTLWFAKADDIVNYEDVKTLSEHLADAETVEVRHSKFNHFDFLWARDVRLLLNDQLLEKCLSGFLL